jgi:hypothetical protein
MHRSVLLSMVAVSCCGLLTSASAIPTRCLFFSGTADALGRTKAIEGSLTSLHDAIDKWKAANGITGPVSETAERPEPQPYWRSAVSPYLFYGPDMVTDSTYTICWHGVVSPVVCTSGAKLCW